MKKLLRIVVIGFYRITMPQTMPDLDKTEFGVV